jgi:outer membrane protein TolC
VQPPAAATNARRVTLNEAIQLAVGQGPEITAAVHGVHAAEARVRGAGAQRFPRLHTDANIQYWNSPLDVKFSLPAGLTGMPGQTGMTDEAAAAAASVPAMRVRDQLTWQFSATIAQPLTGLIALGRLMQLEEFGVNAARADQQRALLDTAQRASEAYLRLLQAKALEEVSEKSLRQVEAQLQRAETLERGGVMQRVDVLRLTAARDNARHAVMRAQTSVITAGEALVLALNLPTGTTLDVVDDLPDPPLALALTAQDALTEAKQTRPEIIAARERSSQASAGEDVASAALYPNINALATYQHTEGQSTFQPKNAFFVGATLSWDVWDWGKSVQGIREAEARSEQARVSERMLHDQIAFDVRRRIAELRTNYATLDVARSALEAAEEAFRIQEVSYREGSATTTDVLDTETEVSRARSSYAQARYEYYLAQAGLARAVGQLPTAKLGGVNAVR